MLNHTELNDLILKKIRSQSSQQENSLDRWYGQCYPVLIDSLSRERNLKSKVTIAIVATGSWVPRIITGDIDDELINQFRGYYNSIPNTIEEISIDPVNKKKKSNVKSNANTRFRLSEYYMHCNRLVNSVSIDRADKNASTVSKFMHFLSPTVFPIFDINIAKRVRITLSKSSINLSMNQYSKYIAAISVLKEKHDDTWRRIENLAEESECSPIRIIDKILFRE